MKKIMLLLLCPVLVLIACNESGKSEPVSKDSIRKDTADSVNYNPGMQPAQNSDDPNRFSQ